MWGDLLQFIGDLLYNRAAILTGSIPVAVRLFGSARAGKRFLWILCSGSDAMNDFFVLFTGLQPFDNRAIAQSW